ncbi:MAG: dihydroorotase family protein [Candidatus Heimdallarchaeota archaeon]
MLWWLKNVKIWFNNQLLDGAIEIDATRRIITRISRKGPKDGINGQGLWVLPGMIDIHVHLRDFGESHKEDFLSGSLAALHGGVTTVFDMPNKKPPVITLDDLARVRAKINKESLIDVYSYLLFTKMYSDWGSHRFLKGIYGGTFGAEKSSMDEIIWAAENFSGILALHLEDPHFFNENSQVHHQKRPPKAEVEAVRQLIRGISHRRSAHVHLAHLSTKKALAILAEGKKHGITCEATPHHAFLDEKSFSLLGKRSITNPPIRSASNRHAIHQGIISGLIDIVASDHAPHTLEEKENENLAGVPGLETTLPILLTDRAHGNLSIDRVVHLYSEGPSRLMGLNDRGKISEGKIADFVLIDPNKEWKLKSDDLYSKSKWSPFEGQKFVGMVAATFKNGKNAFSDENLLPGSFSDNVPSI